MSNQRFYEDKIYCSKEAKKKLRKECLLIFLKAHPEYNGFKITEGYLLERVINYYIEN